MFGFEVQRAEAEITQLAKIVCTPDLDVHNISPPLLNSQFIFFYDMDLVDLIIFTVGDLQGCWNELHAICNGSKEMRIVTT